MGRAVWVILLLVVPAVWAQETSGTVDPPAAARVVPDAAGDPVQIEAEVVALLAAGRQAEAEYRLRADAAALEKSQRLAFLSACFERSRFNVYGAAGLFMAAAKMGATTVEGRAADLIFRVDARMDTEANFAALEKLADEHPKDPFLRWMAAVLCRELKKNERGVEHYKKLLAVWDPGPVLVHQTYANLLDKLERYEESLVSRRLAVKLEPAGWSYQGLAVTLGYLKQYEESYVWFERAVKVEPNSPMYWRTWGMILHRDKKYEDAIAKCRKALELDPESCAPHDTIGYCLRDQEKYEEAIAEFEIALRLNPSCHAAKPNIEWMRQQLALKGAKK